MSCGANIIATYDLYDVVYHNYTFFCGVYIVIDEHFILCIPNEVYIRKDKQVDNMAKRIQPGGKDITMDDIRAWKNRQTRNKAYSWVYRR